MDKYLTRKEVMERLGVCEQTLYRLCKTGKIVALKVGEAGSNGRVCFTEQAVEAYIRSVKPHKFLEG